MKPSGWIRLGLGLSQTRCRLVSQGGLRQGDQRFRRCHPAKSGLGPAFLKRGIAWYLQKDYDKAIKDFDEAIRLDPKNAAAYRNRGDAWSEKDEYDKGSRT